ncbi:hypothetical protein KFL_000200500 [Klebsormidium nitens]|uniref:Uncharacterized protein n=1 Tax=Klebsormidium nitens TaxID=105231 RepID=A0A1Y1HSU7_KLENI|nr:hypothetical protein KFL_000200500 [Klebsormidium nitens]|eukprot:GAQ78898.1 hypothetical protein KFL_000200500 [Klebsormidium nitens]
MSGAIAQLLWTLRRGSPAEQARAGHKIYQLESMGGNAYKNDKDIVAALVDQGGIPLAIELMDKGSAPVQEAAALILRPICQNIEEYRQKILAADVLPPLLKMLRQGPSAGPAHYAAGLIVNLAYAKGGPKQVREGGALPLLFQMVQESRTPSFGRYQATDALGSLAKHEDECARAILASAGLLQQLVSDLADPSVAAVAASTVGHVGLKRPWALDALLRCGAIPALVAAFDTQDDDQLDRAVHALLQLASCGESVRPAIVQAGGLPAILTVLEKRDVPDRCVQSCAACIIYWLWQMDSLQGPINTALASFVQALGPRLASSVEAESVTALKGLSFLVDRKKFQQPEISASLVQTGVIPLLESAATDARPGVQTLALQTLHGMSLSGMVPAARDALLKLDFAAPILRMMRSADPQERATGGKILCDMVAYEERTDAWWADPPGTLRPADFAARRLVDAGVIPICLQWMRDITETEAVRCSGGLAVTRICCFRLWGQVAVQHSSGIQCALEVLVRPDTPPALRHRCAVLLRNALAKNAHTAWTFVQAGGVSALFRALELMEKGSQLTSTVEALMTTLHNVWEIAPQRPHVFPALKAFVDQIAVSARGPWERRDRLLMGLFTALDPEVATPDPTLQDAFIQAGAFTLLVPMLSEPIVAAQIWAAEILRALVIANQATKRTLNAYGGLTRLFEALGGGNPGVQTVVLRCLGEELHEASELSVLAINKMAALKLLTQCVLHGEAPVQEKAMWVIGRMTLNQAVVARLLGQEKPRQLIPILIKKVKDSAAQPELQYHAVYALEFLTVQPEDNIKLALKSDMVPIYMDVIRNAGAEDRTRVRALSTLTDNSRGWHKFQAKCSRAGIYKLTWTLKDDAAASPAVRDAAAQAYRDMWKAMGESVLSIVGPFSFSMRSNILNGSRA